MAWQVSARAGVWVIVFMLSEGGARADPPSEQIERLVRQAGNVGDDGERANLLRALREMPEAGEALKADADKLIEEIERWLREPNLTYFGPEISKTLDYNFGIAPDSPLYSLTHLYRGRMLVWFALEHGGVWNHPEKRREVLDKARDRFEQMRELFPENPIARMYLGEPISPRKSYPPAPGAPEWAIYQREALDRLTDIIEWWIDHRMQPDGSYGGGWGDDCEMWRWWVPVLIGFEERKLVEAQARFSQALMSQPHMRGGYTTHLYDVEHTAEDSSDVITPMMHLQPDDPLWADRALRLVELMETLWTGVNERGLLQFKSAYFSVDRVDENPQRACDTTYHPRAVQPALLYWQRTGDARLTRLFASWMDAWVDAAARAERGKPAGILPSAIHWPDGAVGGLGEHWWDPRCHGETTLYEWPSALEIMTHTLLLTFHMTGDAKYLEPIRSMARIRLDYLNNPPEGPVEPGGLAWCGQHLGRLRGVLAKYRLLRGEDEFDQLLVREQDPYMVLRLRHDRGPLALALRNTARSLRFNFEGYTSEVRYTDRVLRFPALFQDNGMFPRGIATFTSPDTGLLYATVTGDPGDAGYCPMNAVRWLTPARDIAVLVTASDRSVFRAELFHFSEAPREMGAEFYLLAPGRYGVALVSKDGDIPLVERELLVSGERARVAFELPPRTLCELCVERRRSE